MVLLKAPGVAVVESVERELLELGLRAVGIT
jgi:hypothetical protein